MEYNCARWLRWGQVGLLLLPLFPWNDLQWNGWDQYPISQVWWLRTIYEMVPLTTVALLIALSGWLALLALHYSRNGLCWASCLLLVSIPLGIFAPVHTIVVVERRLLSYIVLYPAWWLPVLLPYARFLLPRTASMEEREAIDEASLLGGLAMGLVVAFELTFAEYLAR